MKKALLILCFLIVGTQFLFAQSTGTLAGTVVDDKGAKIPGANVIISNSNMGEVTNTNGQFEIKNVPEGQNSLSVRFVGYKEETLTVDIKEGLTTYIEVKLQPETVMLEGLVVTAQRRSQANKDVPIAISSIGSDFLSNTNTFEFDALSEFVPGLQVQIQSTNNPGFVIRGITSDNGDSRVEPRVSVFQDGVSISKSRGSVVELYDMERVEVLKGPQGTLFGRGAQIGAIHLIQNKAKSTFSSNVKLGVGDYGQVLATGHVNVPLADNLFLRVAGIYNKRDGFLENVSGSEALNGKDTKAGRVSLKYLPGKNTAIDFIFNAQEDTPPGTSFKSGTYAPIGGDLNPNSFADLERGDELGIDRKVWGTTLIVNHTMGRRWDLTSITAFREFDSYESFDADGTAAPALWFAEDAYGRQFSQELRFNYADESRFSGFTGLSFFHENGYQRVPYEGDERSLYTLFSPFIRGSIQGNPDLNDEQKQQLLAVVPFEPLLINGVPNLVTNFPNVPPVFGPLAGVPLKPFHTEESTNFGINYAYEAFADGTFTITDKFNVTAGIRGTFEQITGALEVPAPANPGRLGFLLQTAGSPTNIFATTDGRQETTETFLSAVGRLAFNYDLSKSITLFGNVARGRRPNVVQVLASETNVLNAETVWSYELGAKSLALNDRLQFDVNGYIYDYNNFQTSIVVQDEDGLRTETRDAGRASAVGFELSSQFAVSKNISAFANYGYIDAEINEEDSEGNPQDLGGNTFRLTPKNSFSAGLDVSLPFNDNFSIYFRPTYSYKSRVFFEETNIEGIEQEAYGILNLRLGAVFFKNYDLMLFMNNALDEEYIIDAGNTGGGFGIPTFIAGPPRMMGAQINIKIK